MNLIKFNKGMNGLRTTLRRRTWAVEENLGMICQWASSQQKASLTRRVQPCDCPPLLHSCKTSPGVQHPTLGSTVPERHEWSC